MKNLIALFLCVALVSIVAPVIFVGRFSPRWEAQAADSHRNDEAGIYLPGEFPNPTTGDVSKESAFLVEEDLAPVAGDPAVEAGEGAVRVPVLMYHHIRPMLPSFSRADRSFTTTPEEFATQMQALKSAGYRTITPQDMEQALKEGAYLLPAKPVLITFDDGFRDQYENAWPVLQSLGLRATFFIVSRAYTLSGCMKPDQIKELDASGLITIASHTKNHAFLTRVGKEKREDEILGSKLDLEMLLGHPVDVFSFPYGSWSREVAKEVEAAGFRMGFGVRLGSLHTTGSLFELRRIRVMPGDDILKLLERFSIKQTQE